MNWERMGPAQLALLVATLIVVVIFVQTRVVSVDLHNRRLDLLLQLERAESRLDRDVDNVIAFRLVQYDAFVDHVRGIQALTGQLGSAPLALPNRDLLNAYLDAVREKLDLMERIKSQTALVRNGLRYLSGATVQMGQRDAMAGAQVADLLNALLHYQLFPDAAEAEALVDALEDASAFAEVVDNGRPLFNNILFHLRANLQLTREQTRLRDRYAAVSSDQRFEALYRDYTDAYARQSGRAEQFSVVLLVVVVALFTGLGFVLRALSRARFRSERAHDQLRSAVESLSDAFALFAPDGRLVLCNHRYAEFYPWLEQALEGPTTLDEIGRLHAESGRFQFLESTSISCDLLIRSRIQSWSLQARSR